MTKVLMILKAISLGKFIAKEGISLIKFIKNRVDKSKKLSDADRRKIIKEINKIEKQIKLDKLVK